MVKHGRLNKGFWRNLVQKCDFINLEVRLDEYKI